VDWVELCSFLSSQKCSADESGLWLTIQFKLLVKNMTNNPSIPTTTETIQTPCDRHYYHSLCWGAVLAGTVAAIGIHLLLTALGVGAGLATFSPMTDTNPVANFSAGAAIAWSVCAIIALWFGGLIAGRFSGCPHRGFAHGILVWSLTLILTLLLLSLGTGMVLGGALKVLGEGVGIGGKAVASGVGDLAKTGAKRSDAQLGSFIEEAVQSVPTNATPKASTRARREIGFAVTKLFAPGNEAGFQVNRMAAINALVEYAQMTETDATKTIDDWTTSHKNLQAELANILAVAEQKARATADRAAHNLSCAAIWSFFALLIGLLAAAFGGQCGARCALRHANLLRSSAMAV
jgi:hypothetical protein